MSKHRQTMACSRMRQSHTADAKCQALKTTHRKYMKYCPQCASKINDKSVDGESRLACSKECGYIFWNNPIPVSAGLVEINGKYLLARNKTWPEGFFSLITGFIETGESPGGAIKRETEEELGLKATLDS